MECSGTCLYVMVTYGPQFLGLNGGLANVHMYTVNDKVKLEKSFAVHWISFKSRKNYIVGFVLKALQKAIAHKIHVGKTFALSRKSTKITTFSSLNFYNLQYMCV